MPCSITLTLDARVVKRLPDNPLPALHANFFKWLETADVALAKGIHDVSDPKPFTLSPLLCDGEPSHSRFRITLLDDALWPCLRAGIESRPFVRILTERLQFVSAMQVEQRTYTELAQEASTHPVAILRFETPTNFRSHGMNYPLPDPMMVFASYHARWNAFAPEALRISESWLEWVARSIGVSQCSVQSQVVVFKQANGSFQHIGFVGAAQFNVLARDGKAMAGRAPFNALADYAYFCGTGYKTTQGMGQTKRLERWTKD